MIEQALDDIDDFVEYLLETPDLGVGGPRSERHGALARWVARRVGQVGVRRQIGRLALYRDEEVVFVSIPDWALDPAQIEREHKGRLELRHFEDWLIDLYALQEDPVLGQRVMNKIGAALCGSEEGS